MPANTTESDPLKRGRTSSSLDRATLESPKSRRVIICTAVSCIALAASALIGSVMFGGDGTPRAFLQGLFNSGLAFEAAGNYSKSESVNGNIVRDGYMPPGVLHPMESGDGDGRLLVHTWFEGFLIPGFHLLISSALVTQDLEKTKLIIWMDEPWAEAKDDRKREIIKKYRYTPHGFVEYRLLSANELAERSSSCWKDRPEFMLKYPIVHFFGGYAFYSDVVRILLLQIYGGIWIDSDTTILADFQNGAGGWNDLFVRVASGRSVNANLGNNNLLYMTDKRQRDIVADISCEFRARPDNITRLNYTQEESLAVESTEFRSEWGYTLVKPMAKDGTEMRVVNNWIWNEGVLKLCYELKGLCNYHPLGFDKTDPLWRGPGGLYDMCEAFIDGLGLYVPSIEVLWRSTRVDARNVTSYWEAEGLQSITWVAHDRNADCRTNGAGVKGTLAVFETLINLRLGNDAKQAPIEPLDFIGVDPWMLRSRHLGDSDFSQLTIIVKSKSNHLKQRRLLRALTQNFLGFIPKSDYDAHRQLAFSPRIRFVLEFPDSSSRQGRVQIGRLVAESSHFGDILFVPPSEQTLKRQSRKLADPSEDNPVGIINGTLMYPNLTLYDKWGIESVLNPTPFPQSPIPETLKFKPPTLEIHELDQDELTYSTWGERRFKGDGFVSPEMELGLMKWSLTSESLFLMILNDDNVFFNLRKVIDILNEVNGSELFHKESELTTFVVGLPIAENVTNTVQEPNEESRESFTDESLTGNASFRKMLNTSRHIISDSVLRESKNFSGILVSRNVLPYLLSSDNPIKRACNVLFHQCAANSTDKPSQLQPKVAAEYSPLGAIYTYSASQKLHTCLDGRKHPLNSRLMLNKRRFSGQRNFQSSFYPHLIRVVTPDSFGLTSLSFDKSFANDLTSATQGSAAFADCLSQYSDPSTNKTKESKASKNLKGLRDVTARSVVISSLPEECPDVVRVLELLSQGYLL